VPLAYVGDIRYADTNPIEAWKIAVAYTTGKARHTEWLLNDAYGQACFVKRPEWSYEMERRLVVDRESLKMAKVGLVGHFPSRALRYIIVGARADDAVARICRKRADEYGVTFAQFEVGKKTFHPYFVSDGGTLRWKGRSFARCASSCKECNEPARTDASGRCAWCSITKEEEERAAVRSLWAIAANFKLMEPDVGFSGAIAKGSDVRKRAKKG
ncbi:MAG: hypothetical protein ACLQPV_07860, partial [Vulcanimicrobiaceae bacterium]